MCKLFDAQTPPAEKSNALGWICLLLFALFILVGGLIFSSHGSAESVGKGIEHIAKICHDVPCFIGLAMLAVLWLLYALMSGNASPLELMRGKDNKFSISKCQFLLWTVLVFFSYTTLVATLIGQHQLALFTSSNGFGNIPSNLLLAMGLSVTTVLAAKGIVVSQISSGTLTRDAVAPESAEYGDLLKDEDGAIDLSKVQMMGWTVVGLVAYLAIVLRMVSQIQQNKLGTSIVLPDIDTSLMVLMGLGHGTYLVKKLITAATPAISGIKGCAPGTVCLDGVLEISGSGFGAEKADSMITLNGMSASFPILSWSPTLIKLTLSKEVLQMPPGKFNLCVVVSNQQSNPMALTVVRAAKIDKVSVSGTDLHVEGSGLGIKQPAAADKPADGILINGKAVADANISAWGDAVIVLANPDTTALKAGAKVKIVLTVDGKALPEVELVLS